MSERNLLVVAGTGVDTGLLREHVKRHVGEQTVRVRIVTAASGVSRLDWLTNDEDDVRAEAQSMADEVAAAVGPGTVSEGEVGDSDPVQAVEDALRTFPADELILVTQPGTPGDWLEQGAGEESFRRFGLPVVNLVLEGSSGRATESRPAAEAVDEGTPREVARGRTARTPLFLLGGVATLVWGAAAALIVVALILWLALR